MFKISNILILGTGSIANRHVNNLFNIYEGVKIFNFSRSNRLLNNCFKFDFSSVEKSINFDLIIIASKSNCHDEDLLKCINFFNYIPLIFIEKPITLNVLIGRKILSVIHEKDRKIYVGYDLRYSPGIQFLKNVFDNEISNCKDIVIRAKVSQNLDFWRNKSINFTSYSYIQRESGGIVFDLSHEIDFINFITNTLITYNQININSNFFNRDLIDIAILNGSNVSSNYRIVSTIQLDCVSHYFQRYVEILTPVSTYTFDLMNGIYTKFIGNMVIDSKTFDTSRDNRYRLLWKDIFESNCLLPTYEESLNMLESI